jgi:hypothetical protein
VGPPRTQHCVAVGSRGPNFGPAFSSQTSQALMRRGSGLQAQISLPSPARLPGQAHRPRYSEGSAAPRTRLIPATPGRVAQGSCAGVLGQLGPDSVWEHHPSPRPQIGSHQALRPGDRDQSPRSRAPGLVLACLVAVSRNQGQGRANTIRTPGETAPTAVPCITGSCPPPARPARAERVYPRDT